MFSTFEHATVGAVIGIHDKIKGQSPVGFVVLKAGTSQTSEEVEKECVSVIRRDVGPVRFSRFVWHLVLYLKSGVLPFFEKCDKQYCVFV